MKVKIINFLCWLITSIVSLSGFLYESCKETHTIGNTIFAMVCLTTFGWCFVRTLEVIGVFNLGEQERNMEEVNVFEKGKEWHNLFIKREKEIKAIEEEIVELLTEWFEKHEEELEEHYNDAVHWYGINGNHYMGNQFRDWYYNEDTNSFKLKLSIGWGDDTWYSEIKVFSDGHWER
jgi:hypothetical protein